MTNCKCKFLVQVFHKNLKEAKIQDEKDKTKMGKSKDTPERPCLDVKN